MKKDKEKGAGSIRIVLTGGHAATTALATLDEIVRRSGRWDIYWIGTKKAIEGKAVPTLESKIFSSKGIRSYSIIAGRIQVRFTFWTLSSIAKIPFGFIHALFLLLKIRPKIILSFGGFAAFPVVVAGFLLRIPVVIHEQTMAVGRANKYSSLFAKKIALAREESREYFPKEKCVVVGNPILTQIAEVKPKTEIGKPPTVFITGGSRGSQIMNELVVDVLEKLLKDFVVIHQVGFLDNRKIEKVKDSLAKELREKYEVYPMIDPMDLDGVYKRADVVISRAGANTVAEIVATKRPAILIPIPWSYQDEQAKNAEFAEKFGLAKVLNQEELTGDRLAEEITNLVDNWEEIITRTKNKKSPDIKAAKRLVDLLEETMG